MGKCFTKSPVIPDKNGFQQGIYPYKLTVWRNGYTKYETIIRKEYFTGMIHTKDRTETIKHCYNTKWNTNKELCNTHSEEENIGQKSIAYLEAKLHNKLDSGIKKFKNVVSITQKSIDKVVKSERTKLLYQYVLTWVQYLRVCDLI